MERFERNTDRYAVLAPCSPAYNGASRLLFQPELGVSAATVDNCDGGGCGEAALSGWAARFLAINGQLLRTPLEASWPPHGAHPLGIRSQYPTDRGAMVGQRLPHEEQDAASSHLETPQTIRR